MPLDYTQPNEGLARELREVARDAVALNEALTKGLNLSFPPDSPNVQLIEIARSLAQLPAGTAEGSRSSLEYARDRLPAIRRAHVLSEELDVSKSDADAAPPILRGALIDQRLRDLITSVTTALDEYRRLAAEEPPEEAKPQEAVIAPTKLTEEAVAQSSRLELKLAEAKTTVEETTKPGSLKADNLKRQINDAQGLNRLARTELRMPKIVVHWYRRTVDALKDYPPLIKKTAAGLKDNADIVHIGLERWHDFKRNSTTFLVDEFKKTCDSFIVVSEKLDERRRSKSDGGALAPEDFEWGKVYEMIFAGISPPESWRPFIDHLRLERRKELKNLMPISGLTNMDWLELWGTSVSDIIPLSGLTKLKYLGLNSTQVSDITALSALTKLKEVYLGGTKVTDISTLAALTNLEELNLDDTQVSNFAPLAALTNLEKLNLDATQVSNLAPLAALTKLKKLDLKGTSVSDVSKLAALTNLEELNLAGTQVSNLAPLINLKKLKHLNIANTRVRSLTPLSRLMELEHLEIQDTQISSVRALSRLEKLRHLDLARTQVSDLWPLQKIWGLSYLDPTDSLITDLSPLDHMIYLDIEGAPALARRSLKKRPSKKKK